MFRVHAINTNTANVYDKSEVNTIISLFDNQDVSHLTYSKKPDVHNKIQLDSLMAQNEPLCITKAPIIKQMIIQDNGKLGISLELTSDFIDAVNTINTKAEQISSCLKSEVDNKFSIVNDLIQTNYFTNTQLNYSFALNADLNTQATLITNNTNAITEINTTLNN